MTGELDFDQFAALVMTKPFKGLQPTAVKEGLRLLWGWIDRDDSGFLDADERVGECNLSQGGGFRVSFIILLFFQGISRSEFKSMGSLHWMKQGGSLSMSAWEAKRLPPPLFCERKRQCRLFA